MPHRVNQQENYDLVEQYNPRTGDWINDTKDILLRFLQDLFFQMPAGEGCFHFEPGEESGSTQEIETELIITDQGAVNTDTVEKRPALILSRGPFAYGNTSLDQLLDRDGRTDKRTHTDLLSGSFVINCVSRHGLEAEKLALIVARAIRIYRRNLQIAGFFYIGHLVQIGAESPAGALLSGDSDEDFINVAVTFPIYYQDSWTVEADAELLQTLTLKLHYVARHFNGTLLDPDSLDEDGNPIESAEGVIVTAWRVTSEE